MPEPELLCRTATAFDANGAIDEEAFRIFLQRFVDARIGVYLGSLGSGESGALAPEELRRVYRIGVDACKGRIPVHGNPPEKLSVRETLDHVLLAVNAGVEIVNVYGPAGWHGYRPTDEEVFAFFEALLAEVKQPGSLSPNPSVGPAARPAMIAGLCRRHRQIVAINLADQNDDYFLELRERLDRDVALNVPLTGSMEMLLLGANGIVGAEPNMVPATYRQYLDLHTAGRYAEAATVYANLKRFVRYVGRWKSAHPRWIKMMMKAFGMPGSGIRSPYRAATEAEQRAFVEGLLRLGVPEIDAMARAAGLSPPA